MTGLVLTSSEKTRPRSSSPLIVSWDSFILSYPPVDDSAGPWNTAMNAACVLHITWLLYHIGDVTSIVFHCFQGRPHHFAQLTSLWRHDFSPDTQSATVRRSIFRNLFRPLFNETVFYGVFGVVLRFVLLEQTKLLDAEFKYLIIFSIWVKSTLLNWNKPRVLHDFDTPRVEWPYIQWQHMKESYSPWTWARYQTGGA